MAARYDSDVKDSLHLVYICADTALLRAAVSCSLFLSCFLSMFSENKMKWNN